ncbi:hypothetical protein MA16_Dca028510 [Dendrobium catenatum]|uniref:Reverse transcriptase zinc-binding domain-containing protein n=1 Tax=Dendrobium catenatum TaxID=906689 RepID=A0A2I0VC65_9ASPA|nr:hypothetical protein MA16_Dca028510 [Dendrobium catenatum]
MPLAVFNAIIAIPIYDCLATCLTWGNSGEGLFGQFVRKFYEDFPQCSWYNMIWHKHYVMKFSIFSWLMLVGGLKTTDAFLKRKIHVDPTCYLCHAANESIPHFF